MTQDNKTQTWSSGFIFILAAIGSAVGLGNIWKFPFTAGENGGGAFVLIYILAVMGFALPILIGELLIGRRGKHSPPASIKIIAREVASSPRWGIVGWLGIIIALIILPLYSMVAGWALAFIPILLGDGFQSSSPEEVSSLFNTLVSDPVQPAFFQGLFMLATGLIVASGLKNGIERAVKYFMPLLFIMLLGMVFYAALYGNFAQALRFLFTPDFSKINTDVILAAIGQAFFSVNVGLGIMITFGSYLKHSISLSRAALIIVGVDTVVAIIAGLMIFPLVFAGGLDPAEGPGLIFVTLPMVFAEIFGGVWFGVVFFLMLFFAALTSTISVLEVPVAWALENKKISRKSSALLISLVTWVFGLLAIFSFNILSDVYPLGAFEAFENSTFFDLLEHFSFNILLPASGLAIAVFLGWKVPDKIITDELGWTKRYTLLGWRFSMRFLCPLAIFAILVQTLFR